MNIDYVHFYVEDAPLWRHWFIHTLGFRHLASSTNSHTQTEAIGVGEIRFLLSSPLNQASPIAHYLALHPPGIADIAFQVLNLEAMVAQAAAAGATVRCPIQYQIHSQGWNRWAQVSGWGDLSHTLVERRRSIAPIPLAIENDRENRDRHPLSTLNWDGLLPAADSHPVASWTGIDHLVLNVPVGELGRAIAWYETAFGFQRQQAFSIHTGRSGLHSQVLVHPDGNAQLPINEPASTGSQIQEFLDLNRGAGIQHIALQTVDIVQAIAQLRQMGMAFLHVPVTYYEQLKQRPGFPLSVQAWEAIAAQQILVDWQPELPQATLLQTFTQPIFDQPTFFFEFIERQTYQINDRCGQAQGFGEGNFRALFEAMEREQMKRGSLN
ncbi:4-hydroxyphenylpyruvate dioxygenase [Oculatella sp. LEGE 06141]|uniref:4-hydroxyphenylpyruvate dioxygenase n=1 Tax=Oculatella sp. LEGE 06141 TaxID=1828648 RepID=UPI0018808DCD|nr:4-hydroxyphenylpyruvate dioxygenase [Oculatella sp. LEGE 06141]MBE9177759.1 4-hydroxyphenylpyruvate dioxygenase [Oculatella sp. LEGE 06141]